MKGELPSTIGQGTTVFLASMTDSSVGNSLSNGNNYS